MQNLFTPFPEKILYNERGIFYEKNLSVYDNNHRTTLLLQYDDCNGNE